MLYGDAETIAFNLSAPKVFLLFRLSGSKTESLYFFSGEIYYLRLMLIVFYMPNAEFTRPKSYVAFVALCEAPQKARNFLGLSATTCYK